MDGDNEIEEDNKKSASNASSYQNNANSTNGGERVSNGNELPNYRTASEYAAAVNQWLWQCYYWQWFATSLPYVMMQTLNQNQQNVAGTTDMNRNFPNAYFPNQNLFTPFPAGARQQYRSQNGSTPQDVPGRDFCIPPLWKRFAAETIDFFILLVLKVMVTYIAVDFFEIINLEKYDFDLLRDDKMDYRMAMEVTSEIVTLEIIHRFVVCLFEALCLHHGTQGPGGSTPGKSLLRLRVVSCRTVVPLDSNRVRVYPAGDIGFGWALLRAFIKNFSLAFIFPIFFTMFFFQHNRTAYDIICSSIVVEDLPQEPRRN